MKRFQFHFFKKIKMKTSEGASAPTVLVVEDEPILSKALQLELDSAGFHSIAVDNGQDALKKIKAGGLDLVLLDLLIPVKSGFEVLKEMQKADLTQKIPVIVLSNLGQDEDKRKTKELGAKDFFVKSDTDLGKLVSLIRKII
ncbi:MAG TPA: response regulator [Candidatus Gracilibacteria bacterium]|nr:response regulator [Candidatus Gracilibacteria bacterium]